MKSLLALALLSATVVSAATAQQSTFEDLSVRASAARDSNDPAHAIELYKQALEANPKWAEGWWFLGTLLYDGDHYAEGRDALNHLIALQPDAAPVLQILGLCEFETGEYAASLSHIQRGLAAASPTPQMEAVLHFHLAMALTRTALFDKALLEYVWFARKGIQNPELLAAIGLASLRTPLLPNAIPAGQRDLYEKAGKAAYLSMSGDFPSAREALTELVRQYPNAHHVHYLYGCFLLAAAPDAAMDELRRELEITPQSGAANAMLALVLLQRGDVAVALPYAKAAAEREATSSLAQYVCGRALLEQGDAAGAVAHLRTAETLDPSNFDTHVSLAAAYSRAGQPAEARRERLQSLTLWEGKTASANP